MRRTRWLPVRPPAIPPRFRPSLLGAGPCTQTASMEIRPFEARDEASVVALWQTCELVRPWNDPHQDIQRKLKVRPDLFLVGEIDGAIVASVMAGFEGHRGWINYLAVDPRHQRQGLGRRMMGEAERRLREAGCPKVNLQVRTTNGAVIEFYRRLGYTVDDVVSMGKRLPEGKAVPR
jgi:ribosomal protein S18 acetylase RimI-like enzyme